MTNFIPIFPLSLVVYPGESLHLHIFEPRYIQLIEYCSTQGKPFGIPTVMNNTIADYGTLVEITEISKRYPDGKMDIKTKGIQVFKILELIKDIPEKLYRGAIVSYSNNYNNGSAAMMKHIVTEARRLHQLLSVQKNFSQPDDVLQSYDVAHHVGMSLEQEYQLLEYENELHRQEFLKRHLQTMLPVVQEMENLKTKIHLNGHFKNLEGFNL